MNIKSITVSTSCVVIIAAIAISGCKKSAVTYTAQDSTQSATQHDTVSIIPADPSPEFPKAKLTIVSPREGQVLKNAGDSVLVIMNVTGMDLAKATTGDSARGIAYSKEGQHVHVIVDDKPYMADYKNGQPFNVGVLSPGLHVIRAFPSRSWHESVKALGAFAIRSFIVGAPNTTSQASIGDLKGPMLTYSRPKGSYTKAEGQKLLLDFYLSNAKLSPKDYKVIVSVDGNQVSTITDWKAYYITGLTSGSHTVKLQLMDSKGSPVPGLYNAPSGKVTIE